MYIAPFKDGFLFTTSNNSFNLTNRNSVIPDIVRRMKGFYNHLRNSESPIIIDSLKLSVELNEEGKTLWLSSVKKIGEALNTPIDLLVNSKVKLLKSS